MKNLIIVLSVLVVVVLGVSWFGMDITYHNTEVDLTVSKDAQTKVNEAFYDSMWKILSQQAGIADKYAEDFKSIYIPLMEGRYGKGNGDGSLMKWVQERNPTYDTSLLKKLSQNIEAKRTAFFVEQKKLISIKQEHDKLRLKFPSRIFVGDVPEMVITVITSTKTDKVFKSGKEDDISLF